MSYSLFDTHTHFDVPDFDADREQLAHAAKAVGVERLILIGFVQSRFQDLLYTQHFLNQLKGAPQSYLAPGLHPVYIEQHQTSHLADLEQLVKTEDCVAVGEIGLDTFLAQHKQPEIFQKQRDFFAAQLELAQQFDKPVLLHIRKSHAETLALLKQRNFLVFFLTAIVICIPISFYYQYTNPYLVATGLPNPTAKMAMGQVSEALCLLLIPFLFARLGYKKMMLLGIGAWIVRYLLFAYGNGQDLAFLLITGILLHGVCYDFMFVVGQIYTDTIAGEAYRSSAQGLVTVAMYGIGMLIGFWLAGAIADTLKVYEGTVYWRYLWLCPAALSLICLLIFVLFFKEQKKIAAPA